MLRAEKEAAEVAECTFKPAINGRSGRLMGERYESLKAAHSSAHEQLFQDAQRRQAK